jgi:hypothetical protein
MQVGEAGEWAFSDIAGLLFVTLLEVKIFLAIESSLCIMFLEERGRGG